MVQAPRSNKHLPTSLYSAAQCRALDQCAIQDFAVPSFSLMQKAAQFTFDTAMAQWPNSQSLIAVAGKGNNAGDSYLVAIFAAKAGLQTSVLSMVNPENLQGDAQRAYQQARSAGIEVQAYNNSITLNADIIVDGLLGTGLKGAVRANFVEAITAINTSPGHCIAVDIPSGLCADTGKILGCAVKADITATFIGCKQGLLTGDGPDCTGDIYFSDLEVPPDIYKAVPSTVQRVSTAHVHKQFPPRSRTSHKGSNGHVLLVGGDAGMFGAIMLAAEAALRSGAGLVSVATRPEHANFITNRCPEVMAHGVDSPEQLKPLLKKATVLVLGPGLGYSAWAEKLANTVIHSDLPKVIDADGLNYLARCWSENTITAASAHKNWILTPHPGEAARLLSKANTLEIQGDRYAAVKALHEKYNGTMVLKGAGSLVYGEFIADNAEPRPLNSDGNSYVIDAGNPGMGTGGMGDVLSGVIGALLAQHFTLSNAARVGATVHSLAADRAAQEHGERGLVASDLMPYLRQIINRR